MLFVAELHIGEFELAAPLDIDLLAAIHHDVGDGLVGDQRLQGPEAQHVRNEGVDELALLDKVQLNLRLGEKFLDPTGKLRLESRPWHLCRGRHVHVLEHKRLNLRLAASTAAFRPGSGRTPGAFSAGAAPPPAAGVVISACMISVIRSRRASGFDSIAWRTKYACTAPLTSFARAPA